MKKLNLKTAANEFEIISSDVQLFYNKKTGEFDFYSEHIDNENLDDDADSNDWQDKFNDDSWIAAPRPQDLNNYKIMVDFADTVTNSDKSELLCAALEGKGAFRRFKNALLRTDLLDEWYAFKHKAYTEIAKEWCEENGIEYADTDK